MLIALSTAVHLVAAIVFLSSLFLVRFIFWPTKQGREETVPLLKAMETRAHFLQQVSLGLLLITGMHMMLADDNYVGWFSVRNRWSMLLLLKHILIGILILILGISSVVVGPLQRQTMWVENSQRMLQLNRWHKWVKTAQFSIVIIIILLSTSLITL